MNLRGLIASALLTLLFSPSPAAACRCKEPNTSGAYKRADIVAIARVLEIVPNAHLDGVTATLSVLRSWKGAVPVRITADSGTSCRYPFRVGEEFLLFILRDAQGSFSTARCRGNKPAAEAGPSVRWLERHGTAATVDERK